MRFAALLTLLVVSLWLMTSPTTTRTGIIAGSVGLMIALALLVAMASGLLPYECDCEPFTVKGITP